MAQSARGVSLRNIAPNNGSSPWKSLMLQFGSVGFFQAAPGLRQLSNFVRGTRHLKQPVELVNKVIKRACLLVNDSLAHVQNSYLEMMFVCKTT
jgi:hypothetical protein